MSLRAVGQQEAVSGRVDSLVVDPQTAILPNALPNRVEILDPHRLGRQPNELGRLNDVGGAHQCQPNHRLRSPVIKNKPRGTVEK